MSEFISFASPKRENEMFRNEILTATGKAIDSGDFMLGISVKNFEIEFANFLSTPYCIGVGSGTDALILAMLSLGISAGDEVLVPSFTAAATVVAIQNVGALPVFLDIGENDYCVNPDLIKTSVTTRTKALILVHLYGSTGDIESIVQLCKEYGIFLIEDCAQSAGAKYLEHRLGTFGDISCFSFYPTKNLSAIGDGGAVVTNNSGLAESVMRKRQYGWDRNRECVESGMLSRLDELQARILLEKLTHLDALNSERRMIARQYDDCLANYELARYGLNTSVAHAHHLYVIEVVDREESLKLAQKHWINLGIHYKKSVHQQAFFQRIPLKQNLINSEIAANRVISLPMYPQLNESERERVLSFIEVLCRKNLIAKGPRLWA